MIFIHFVLYLQTVIHRQITSRLLAALKDTPVVYLQGARQSGKSTLFQEIARTHHPARWLTLDQGAARAAAQNDPEGFIAGLESPVVIDEAQRAPGLALAIKAAVDKDRCPGQFLLTGSAGALALPGLSESLAGRMEIHTLWPFSQSELEGREETFIDRLFAPEFPLRATKTITEDELTRRILTGGFPEVQTRTHSRRLAWFDSYLNAILQRDIRDLANINRLSEMPQLLGLMAARTAQLLNFAELARTFRVPQTTLKRYVALLENIFLLRMVPPWFTNISKQFIKTPKLMFADTGLSASLLGIDARKLVANRMLLGQLLENFVALELVKQLDWSRQTCKLFHCRTQSGVEVDILLEDAGGRVAGIEIKCATTLSSKDLRGLNALRSMVKSRFVRGVVLYTGMEPIPFGNDLYALPISWLWDA